MYITMGIMQWWRNTLSHGDAKQISFRLPFTFVQKDWRSYSIRELKNAHQFIYTLDYDFKHGSTMAFDLFFSKFFSNQFV